jgi:hypothetical protein
MESIFSMIVELANTIISEDGNNKVNNIPKNALSCTRYQGDIH